MKAILLFIALVGFVAAIDLDPDWIWEDSSEYTDESPMPLPGALFAVFCFGIIIILSSTSFFGISKNILSIIYNIQILPFIGAWIGVAMPPLLVKVFALFAWADLSFESPFLLWNKYMGDDPIFPKQLLSITQWGTRMDNPVMDIFPTMIITVLAHAITFMAIYVFFLVVIYILSWEKTGTVSFFQAKVFNRIPQVVLTPLFLAYFPFTAAAAQFIAHPHLVEGVNVGLYALAAAILLCYSLGFPLLLFYCLIIQKDDFFIFDKRDDGELLFQYCRGNEKAARYKFLYGDYTSKNRYFLPIWLGFRFAIAMILGALWFSPHAQIILLVLVLVLYCVVLIWRRPLVNQFNNIFEAAASFVLVIIVSLMIDFLEREINDYRENTHLATVFLILFFTVVYVIILVCQLVAVAGFPLGLWIYAYVYFRAASEETRARLTKKAEEEKAERERQKKEAESSNVEVRLTPNLIHADSDSDDELSLPPDDPEPLGDSGSSEGEIEGSELPPPVIEIPVASSSSSEGEIEIQPEPLEIPENSEVVAVTTAVVDVPTVKSSDDEEAPQETAPQSSDDESKGKPGSSRRARRRRRKYDSSGNVLEPLSPGRRRRVSKQDD